MIDEKVLNEKAPKGCGIVYAYKYNGRIVYVGSTKYTPAHRAGVNGKKYVYNKYSSKFGEFILLHGWENLELEIIATPKLSELTKVENEFIDQYDLINNGCNLYHACGDDEDNDGFTEIKNGYKANVYNDDPLRGDVRIGLIHGKVMKLNLIDRDLFRDYYISQCRGNKETNNALAFFDDTGKHKTVHKALRELWFGKYASEYNFSLDPKHKEDDYDFRREVVLVNKVGRSYKKMSFVEALAEIERREAQC